MSSPAEPQSDPPDEPAVWLIGASTRSLAQAARRAGFHVTCSDLFADLDTRQCGPCFQIERYPEDILEHAQRIGSRPVVYAGGLENYPRLLATLAQTHPLWGCAPQVLEMIRDPFRLAIELERHELRMPPIRREPPPRETADEWLLKPLESAGGLGIQRATAALKSGPTVQPGGPGAASPAETASADSLTAHGETAAQVPAEPCYFQRWQSGDPHAAAWLVDDAGSRLLGWTRQLVGVWPWAAETAYCGSVGPLPVPARLQPQLNRLGQLLWEAGVRGLAGVDVLVEPDGLWVLEVNPRPTQSMELMESSETASLFQLHAAVFGDPAIPGHMTGARTARRKPGPRTLEPSDSRFFPGGKLIVYAPADIQIPGDLREFPRARPGVGSLLETAAIRAASGTQAAGQCDSFWFGDVPVPGQTVHAGHPLCTLLWHRDGDARASIAGGCELLSRFTGVAISAPGLPLPPGSS